MRIRRPSSSPREPTPDFALVEPLATTGASDFFDRVVAGVAAVDFAVTFPGADLTPFPLATALAGSRPADFLATGFPPDLDVEAVVVTAFAFFPGDATAFVDDFAVVLVDGFFAGGLAPEATLAVAGRDAFWPVASSSCQPPSAF